MQIPQGWSGDEKRLTRLFEFSSFAAAIAFMVQASFYCERLDHHPEWKNIYNKIWVELVTHDAGAVTEKDHALANHFNDLYQQLS